MSERLPPSRGSALSFERRCLGPATAPGAADAADRIDLAASRRAANHLAEGADLRRALIDHVRDRIAEGTYDDPEKVDALLDDLLEDLRWA